MEWPIEPENRAAEESVELPVDPDCPAPAVEEPIELPVDPDCPAVEEPVELPVDPDGPDVEEPVELAVDPDGLAVEEPVELPDNPKFTAKKCWQSCLTNLNIQQTWKGQQPMKHVYD